jgi:hypothetical protein
MSLRQAVKRSLEEAAISKQSSTENKVLSQQPPVKKSKITYVPPPMTPKKAAAAAAKARENAATTSCASDSTGTTVVTEHTFELISRNDYSLFTEEQKKKLIVAKKRDISMCACHEQDLECDDDRCINRGCKVECIIEMCDVNLANDGRVCKNSRIQQNQRANVEVFDAGDKGRGLRACEDLPAGTFILEYVGEVINDRVLMKRLRRYERAGLRHRYIMEIDKNKKLYVDSTKKANISRYMNHCCEPNSFVELWKCGAEWRAAFFTQKNVRKGEELTFDYHWEALGDTSLIKCQFGAKKCHGYVDYMPHPSGWVSTKEKDLNLENDEFAEMDKETDQETMRKDPFLNHVIKSTAKKSKSSRSNTPIPSTTKDNNNSGAGSPSGTVTTEIPVGFGTMATVTMGETTSSFKAIPEKKLKSNYLEVKDLPIINNSSSNSNGGNGIDSKFEEGLNELHKFLNFGLKTGSYKRKIKRSWILETKSTKTFSVIFECGDPFEKKSDYDSDNNNKKIEESNMAYELMSATNSKVVKGGGKITSFHLNMIPEEKIAKSIEFNFCSDVDNNKNKNNIYKAGKPKNKNDMKKRTNVQFPFFVDWSTSMIHTPSPMKLSHLIEHTLKRYARKSRMTAAQYEVSFYLLLFLKLILLIFFYSFIFLLHHLIFLYL